MEGIISCFKLAIIIPIVIVFLVAIISIPLALEEIIILHMVVI